MDGERGGGEEGKERGVRRGGGEREGGEEGGEGGKVVWVKLSPRTFSPVLLCSHFSPNSYT